MINEVGHVRATSHKGKCEIAPSDVSPDEIKAAVNPHEAFKGAIP